MGRPIIAGLLLAVTAAAAEAAEPPALTRARAAYNAANYDQAIALAEQAQRTKGDADRAALVAVRARLERYRLRADSADLEGAHRTLRALAHPRLMPREQTELLVAQGLTLYLDGAYGAAAEVFDGALARAVATGLDDRERLLEWWAGSLDHLAQGLPAERRRPVYARLAERMEREVRDNPASIAANFWLASATRGAGDADRAWDAAQAAWVRVPIDVPGAPALRQDLDRLVLDGIIPERSRLEPRAEWDELAAGLRTRWEQFKQTWQ